MVGSAHCDTSRRTVLLDLALGECHHGSVSHPRPQISRVLIALTMAAATLPGAGCAPQAASASSADQALPPGVALRSTIAGGVDGRADRLEVTADGIAQLWFQGRLQAATRLHPTEKSHLDELLANGRAIRDGEASRSSATDGIRTTLAFAGRGGSDLRQGVERFTGGIGGRLMANAEVWAAEALVIGRPTGSFPRHGPGKQVRIVVSEVLTAPPGMTISPGAIVDADLAFLPTGEWNDQPRVFRLDAKVVQVAERSFTVGWARGVAIGTTEVAQALEEKRLLGP